MPASVVSAKGGDVPPSNDAASVTATSKAGVSSEGSATIGADGADVNGSLQAGLAAELQAFSERVQAGDENVNASAQASAALEAVLGGKAAFEAHIDKNGITIGGEAKAGAYVSAEVQVNFETNIFGLKTNVTAYAEGHAGAMAQAKAVVTIGFNGEIEFHLSGGVALGIGGSLGTDFSIDASDLMQRLNLPDLSALIEWIAKVQEDPQKVLGELTEEAARRLVEVGKQFLVDKVWTPARDFLVNHFWPTANDIPDIILKPNPGIAWPKNPPLVHDHYPIPVRAIKWPEPFKWPAPIKW